MANEDDDNDDYDNDEDDHGSSNRRGIRLEHFKEVSISKMLIIINTLKGMHVTARMAFLSISSFNNNIGFNFVSFSSNRFTSIKYLFCL